MKIRTDFVTNSSSSGFVVINIESPVLQNLFSDAGVDFNLLKWYEESDEAGIPGCITESAAETIRFILDDMVRSGGIDQYNDEMEDSEEADKILDEQTITKLMDAIQAHAAQIDAEATADIASGDAESDTGGPDFRYAHLKLQSGKGTYVSYCVGEGFYGDDDSPSDFYQWAMKHGLYNLQNERPGFMGGYDESLYFNPPYELIEQSFEGATRVLIEPTGKETGGR